MDKPEALRLADELRAAPERSRTSFEAAAELRRLHAENASLSAALASSCDEAREQMWESGGAAGCSRALSAEFQRDALLALLGNIRGWDMLDATADGSYWKREIDAAIKAVEGEQT